MSDLIERLRVGANEDDALAASVVAFADKMGVAGDLAGMRVRSETATTMREAATYIEQLEAKCDRLTKALNKIPTTYGAIGREAVTLGKVKDIARAALTQEGQGE